jgi:trimeric autotransporter adhesin
MNRLAIFILVSYLGFCSAASGQIEIINTVAGNGAAGTSGDGGSATAAALNQPGGVALDASGNLFIADTTNNRIQKVSAGGIVATVVGSGGLVASPPLAQPGGVFVDGSGNLFIADTGNHQIREVPANGAKVTTIAGGGSFGFYGDGGLATAAALQDPSGVFVDGSGNVFVADSGNNVIREFTVGGNITTVAGNSTLSGGFSGDNGPATSAQLNSPTGVFVDISGVIYIADQLNNRIRKVSGGTITTIAGTGIGGYSGDNGPGTSAELYRPSGVAVDASGNVFIAATYNNRIREVSPGGTITTVAGNGNNGFTGDNGPATSASLSRPNGVALDASGDLFIADTDNNRIREVSSAAPSILPSGVVPVDSTVTTIQPGEWVSIYGSHLATSTATWTGNFPTTLGGASVTIDGIAAYLSYASPGLINVQAPNDTFTGSVPVVVTTAGGSFTSTVTLAQFAPSFLLFDNKHVTGIILRTDGSGSQGTGSNSYDFLGPTGNSLGFPSVAAKAGDSIYLYAVGLGPTTPPIQAGQAFSGAAPTTNTVNLLINNMSVIPSFAGFSSSILYQINLTVPAGLGTGDVPLLATVGGAQTQPVVVISLQ